MRSLPQVDEERVHGGIVGAYIGRTRLKTMIRWDMSCLQIYKIDFDLYCSYRLQMAD
ncbi:hypothetical protein KIN20_014123 [Parelaphostrongylus tenuis]|uniref:Uncharacterized protein n=1 Tax=Parelaphostrongylus tenuis TaxID=148309 RepID=A0AAD5QLG5_PARTN|nr:hypothetical protein KIN20_014123 [Parelaphostrongylus tenuis]